MDEGFAAICQLARTLPASHPVLVHRLASLLHASFRPHLAARPLRFAITSPPSGCEEDLHLQAVDHARHTKGNGAEIIPRRRNSRQVQSLIELNTLRAHCCRTDYGMVGGSQTTHR